MLHFPIVGFLFSCRKYIIEICLSVNSSEQIMRQTIFFKGVSDVSQPTKQEGGKFVSEYIDLNYNLAVAIIR